MIDSPPAPAGSDPLQAFRELLERSRDHIAAVLPPTLTTDRIIKVALATAARSPRILLSSQGSFLQAVLQAAELGLEPGSPLGHAYLIAVPNRVSGQFDCQMRPGYRGLIALARSSGEVLSIEARPVFQRDQFRFSQGLKPVLEHVPTFEENPGNLVCVYAVARLRDGGAPFEVMSLAQIERIRTRLAARAGDEFDAAWKGDPTDETGRRIGLGRSLVVRRLIQSLPLSAELATALTISAQYDDGDVDLVSLLEMQTPGPETVTPPPPVRAPLPPAPTIGSPAAPPAKAAQQRPGLSVTRAGHVVAAATPTPRTAASSAPGLRRTGNRGADLLSKLTGNAPDAPTGATGHGDVIVIGGVHAGLIPQADGPPAGPAPGEQNDGDGVRIKGDY